MELVTLETIPRATARDPGTRIGLVRPKRSRLLRLLADSDLDWRADACTALLKKGWTDVRVEDETASGRA
jgi:hypothetical protein